MNTLNARMIVLGAVAGMRWASPFEWLYTIGLRTTASLPVTRLRLGGCDE